MKEDGSYTLENLSVLDRVLLRNIKFEYTAHNFLRYFLSHMILRGIDAALPEIFYIWDCNCRIMYTIIYNSIHCYCDTVPGKDLKQMKCVCARDGCVPFSSFILFIIHESWRTHFIPFFRSFKIFDLVCSQKCCSFSIYFFCFPTEQLFSKIVCKFIPLLKLFVE